MTSPAGPSGAGLGITGAHVVLYSRDPEADREFLGRTLGFPFVDAGHGWLIFALPPAEVAVHPADESDHHELYLMCSDVRALVERLTASGVSSEPLTEARWGTITHLTLPGGGRLGVYQPKHPTATGLRQET
jgi:catechol 2,3-dioxygenase-like lactoylglutathione lyase family enzyme